MESNYEELPDDIWELILNRLCIDDHHPEFESLSLVNKRLLSLTNRLRRRLTVVDSMLFIHGTIRPVLSRFVNLKALDLSRLKYCYLETALHEIACAVSSVLNLESIDVSNHDRIPIECLKELGLSNRRIKVLKCANVVRLCDDDLVTIAKFFPDLEELDVSYPKHKFTIDAFRVYSISELMITDDGIEALAFGLKNLVRVDISMNNLLTDKSLVDLSTNCLRLQEMVFVDCTMITMKGVRFMVDNSPDIRKISMCLIPHVHGNESLFVNVATSGRRLSSLHFKDSDISDEFLNCIAEAHVPLKCVSLPGCSLYTINGISNFLQAYLSLEFLDLSRNNSLNDDSVIGLSEYLGNLVSVKLNVCRKLTSTALLALINNCSFLEHIEMEETGLGNEKDTDMGIIKDPHPNLSVKSLKLSRNQHLTDECLLKITSLCPNLNLLDLSSCSDITLSLGEVLKKCPAITHLDIQDCGGIMNIGLENEPLKLKKLYMARSGVNDDGLVGIAVRCNELEEINLEGCQHVTTNAVKFMIKNCKKLREVNLMGCPNLHVFIVDWIVHTRPSLRKLVPSSYAVTTKSQRQLWLRHGCQVCDK